MKFPMPIEVVTRSIIDLDRVYSRKIVDYSDTSDRKWLQSHIHWATKNAYQVTVTPQPIRISTVGAES